MGVGNVISGPIADALLATKGFKHAAFAYGIDSYVSYSKPYYQIKLLISIVLTGSAPVVDRRSFRYW